MKKISTLLLLSTALFLSAFFVGCKPQEEPIAFEDILTNFSNNVVKETKPIEKPVKIEQHQIPEIQPEERNKNKRMVIVKVTAEGKPAVEATVTLSKLSYGKELFFEKKSNDNGTAEFHIEKNISGFWVSAYNDDYAVVNVLKKGLSANNSLPVNINVNLEEKGTVITAVIENKPDKIANLQAKIVSAKAYGLEITFAVTTNITDNRIVFPPVVCCSQMRICLTGDNIPECYSEKFNPKINQEINIKIPESSVLKGTALLPDGSPVTNKFTISVFPQKETKGIYHTGKSFGEIQPGNNGSYIFPKISKGSFRIWMRLDNYEDFKTNIIFKSSDNYLNFSFGKIPTMSIAGIVVTELDDSPLEGVTVYARSGNRDLPYASCITDKGGKFTIEVRKTFRDYYGTLFVEEPGYGRISKGINSGTGFIKIVLRQAGTIKGKVLTQDGIPLTGGTLLIYKIASEKRDKNKPFEQVNYKTLIDETGNYEFIDVIAPAKYGFELIDNSGSYYLPVYYSEQGYTVEVEPNQTTEYNLIVRENAVLALNAVDNEGNPVTKFSFTHSITTDDKYTRSTSFNAQVDILDDEWFFMNCDSEGGFNCKAIAEESGLSLSTNDIPLYGGKTNYITLIFNDTAPKIILSGKVLKPDGTPAMWYNIYAETRSGNFKEIHTDGNGSFKLMGKKIKTGENITIRVRAYRVNFNVRTNLPAGAKDVIIKLLPPLKIIGKVFLDDLDSPAKNFIINKNRNKRSYNSKDGSFEFPFPRLIYNMRDDKIITISADDYLPIFVKYDFTSKEICDIGDIILKSGETAKFHGRVVNQNGKPLNITVALKYGDSQKVFSVRTDSEDGTYTFEDVPPGKARVATQSRLGYKTFYDFEVKEGDNLELPDLVLNYTNAAIVTLTFKLPDGTYPESTQIYNKDNFYISDNGVAKGELKFGKYSDWKIKYNGKNYIANEFEITENTDELEVWLQEE